MIELNDAFQALLREAQFTKEMLGSGATEIREASYARKGVYFEAFTSLSTGLERIGKLCLMLDHYIRNKGEFPDAGYLKRKIGHNLVRLYEEATRISRERSISFEFLSNLDGDIHQSIVSILSRFACGDRYSNIDLLVGERTGADPISMWFKEVDTAIFEKHISRKRKERIIRNAQLSHQLTREFTLVLYISETGSTIHRGDEASFRTGMHEAVAPFRQLYVLQIVRFWTEVLAELQCRSMDLGRQDIPNFLEIFAPFYNADEFFKRRERWDTI